MSARSRFSNPTTTPEHFARIQRFTREHQFLIGARAVLGWMPVADAERAYSKLAFAVVHEVIRLVERRLVKLHGRVPGADWALVALGKFGGFELTATSDLDLMLVYQCPDDAPASTGPRCLPATQYFNMLAKNLIAALGAQDGDGPLFEVDFRLRPWGSKGPIATQLSTLRDYLDQESWTYEHMAMTRARVVAGPARFSAAIEAVIRKALQRSAASRQLRTDMLEMHTLVHTAKETRNVWDVKHVRGGMIDIEFIAQYLMLRHANASPNLIHPATGNALRISGRRGCSRVPIGTSFPARCRCSRTCCRPPASPAFRANCPKPCRARSHGNCRRCWARRTSARWKQSSAASRNPSARRSSA